jgi:CRISPR system Cascade subunit CasC
MTTYVEIHALQSVPPSNLNRDDTGSPKSVIIGGTPRIMVSCYAWKRAMRNHFVDHAVTIGTRTRMIGQLVSGRVLAKNPDIGDDINALVGHILILSKLTTREKGKDELVATAVAFLSDGQVEAVSNLVIEHADLIRTDIATAAAAAAAKKAKSKKAKAGTEDEASEDVADGTPEDTKDDGEFNLAKEVKAALKGRVGLDIALFGRMFASDQDLSIGAAAQVAPAYSVHTAQPEFDFFTAVDELKTTSGSAMMGTAELVSANFYRQSNVNVDSLRVMVGEDYIDGVKHFIRAFIESMPSGKMNTYSNKTLPMAVLITIRDDAPRNYVNAFEDAVEADENSILKNAVHRLVTTASELDAAYGAGRASFVVRVGEETAELDTLGQRLNLNDAIDQVAALLADKK